MLNITNGKNRNICLTQKIHESKHLCDLDLCCYGRSVLNGDKVMLTNSNFLKHVR